MNQSKSGKRVATALPPEVMTRAQTERVRIEQQTGCKPSLAKVLAAAIARGLPE